MISKEPFKAPFLLAVQLGSCWLAIKIAKEFGDQPSSGPVVECRFLVAGRADFTLTQVNFDGNLQPIVDQIKRMALRF